MGCGNELNVSDDKAIEESINGENCELHLTRACAVTILS
jgi:hypothetical protein